MLDFLVHSFYCALCAIYSMDTRKPKIISRSGVDVACGILLGGVRTVSAYSQVRLSNHEGFGRNYHEGNWPGPH